MKALIVCMFLLLAPQAARAGAWTQDEGKAQLISGAIVSEADRTFGDITPIRFRRELSQTYGEYGWKDDLTLVGELDIASVNVVQNGGAPFHAVDNAFTAGIRWRWDRYLGLSDIGVFSLEASYRAAGAFNFAISADRSTGGQGAEVRLLYGRNFKWLERDGFVSLEAGEDIFDGERPAETPLDLTAGLWIGANHLLLLQSFNLFAQSGKTSSYPAFNSHKLQASWVYRWSPRTFFQLGAFFSPMGNNALVEQGFCLSAWERF